MSEPSASAIQKIDKALNWAEDEEALEKRLSQQVLQGRLSVGRARFLLQFAYALAFSAAIDGEMRPAEIHEEVQRYSLRFGKVDRRTVAFRQLKKKATHD